MTQTISDSKYGNPIPKAIGTPPRSSISGTMDIRNALGCGGRIYLTVPEMRRGQGKVNVTVQGQLREFECVTDMENTIPTGAEVTVIGISGGDTLIVTKK